MTDTQHIIAIDGTAASGKGTLAKRLADKLGFAYLDTGKLYRYVGWAVIQDGNDPADPDSAAAKAQQLKTTLKPQDLQSPDLQKDEAGQAASKVAAIPAVRDALLSYQKDFAQNPPDGARGAILDGRDIGTVVCPEADIKLYIDAKTEIRAERRTKELQSKGIPVIYEAVLTDMRERDARDAGRKTAPMKPAPDALILDTSEMSIEDVMDKALSYIKSYITEPPIS